MTFGGFEYTFKHQLLAGHLLMLALALKCHASRDQQAKCYVMTIIKVTNQILFHNNPVTDEYSAVVKLKRQG